MIWSASIGRDDGEIGGAETFEGRSGDGGGEKSKREGFVSWLLLLCLGRYISYTTSIRLGEAYNKSACADDMMDFRQSVIHTLNLVNVGIECKEKSNKF